MKLVLLTLAVVWTRSVWAQDGEQATFADVASQSGVASGPHSKAYVDPSKSSGGFKKLLVDFGQDQKQIWTSPTRIRLADATWLVPIGGITTGLFVTDHDYIKSLPNSPSTINHYKNISNIGVAGLVGAGAGMYLMSFPSHNEHWRETGFLAGEAALNSLIPIELMKNSLGRERPYQGDGRGAFLRGGTSFPSEHAAAAWSIAGVIAHEYPGTLPKLLAYGAASAVSYSRIRGHQHFPSDVFVGSVLGYLVAQSVYTRRHEPEVGGGSWESPSEFVDSERSGGGSGMGSPYVPLDSWIYPALERLIALGYIRTAFLGIRPWTRMECARMLAEVELLTGDDDERVGEAPRIYSELSRELSDETGRLSGGANVGASLDSTYVRSTNISGPPLRDGYHFGQTLINDYGRPYGEGLSAIAGLTAHAEVGPLSFYVRGEYQHAPAVLSDPDTVLQATASVDATLPLLNGRAELNRIRLIEGAVGITYRNVQLSFGQQSLWLGPGQAGPLLFTNNAEPIMMLRIDSVSPYEIPLLSKVLGPTRSQFFLGQLSGQHWVFSPQLFGPNLTSMPLLHGTKFSFHPTPNLEMGIGFTAQFGGPGNPFTWRNFLRTFYSHKNATGANPGKRLSEFDLNYRVPGLRNWLQVYVDAMVIDEYSPLVSNRPSINPGIYLSHLPKVPKMDLRLEGVTSDLNVPLHFGPGAVYWDERYHSGYTNNGNLIGSWIGRRGRGQQGWLTYRFSPRTDLQFGYRHNSVDRGFLQGGTLQDFNLSGELMLGHSMSLSGLVQRETWHFPVLFPTGQSNITVSGQVNFWPHRATQ